MVVNITTNLTSLPSKFVATGFLATAPVAFKFAKLLEAELEIKRSGLEVVGVELGVLKQGVRSLT